MADYLPYMGPFPENREEAIAAVKQDIRYFLHHRHQGIVPYQGGVVYPRDEARKQIDALRKARRLHEAAKEITMSTSKTRLLSSHLAYWLKAPKAYVDDPPQLGHGQQFGPGYAFSGGKLVKKSMRRWIVPVWGLGGYQVASLTIAATKPRKWRGIVDLSGYKVERGRALQGPTKGLITFVGTSPQDVRNKVKQALGFAYSDLLR